MTLNTLALGLALATGLVSGCHAPSPPPPAPLVSVQELDKKLTERRQQLQDLANQPVPAPEGRSLDDLQREIQERKARIKFLQGEIDALLRQKEAAEIYYRQKDTAH